MKIAQTTVKIEYDNAYKNHVRRVVEEADTLKKQLEKGIEVGMSDLNSRRYVDSLGATAVDYLSAVEDGVATSELNDMLSLMMQNWNTLRNSYVDQNYELMKNMRESMLYLQNQNQRLVEQQDEIQQ